MTLQLVTSTGRQLGAGGRVEGTCGPDGTAPGVAGSLHPFPWLSASWEPQGMEGSPHSTLHLDKHLSDHTAASPGRAVYPWGDPGLALAWTACWQAGSGLGRLPAQQSHFTRKDSLSLLGKSFRHSSAVTKWPIKELFEAAGVWGGVTAGPPASETEAES